MILGYFDHPYSNSLQPRKDNRTDMIAACGGGTKCPSHFSRHTSSAQDRSAHFSQYRHRLSHSCGASVLNHWQDVKINSKAKAKATVKIKRFLINPPYRRDHIGRDYSSVAVSSAEISATTSGASPTTSSTGIVKAMPLPGVLSPTAL